MFLLFTFVSNFCTNVFFVPDLTNPTFLCWSLFHVLRNICSLFLNFCSYLLVPSVLFLPSNFSYAQSFIFVSCVKNYVPNSCFLNFFLIYYMLTIPIFVPLSCSRPWMLDTHVVVPAVILAVWCVLKPVQPSPTDLCSLIRKT